MKRTRRCSVPPIRCSPPPSISRSSSKMSNRHIAAALLLMLAVVVGGQGRARADETVRVPGTRFVALAQHAIAHVEVAPDSELVMTSTTPDQLLPLGKTALLVRAPMVSPSYVNVPIEVDVDGRFNRTIYVGYRVQRYIRTAVAARDLAAGTVLAADDVTTARVPFVGLSPNTVTALVGRRLLGTVHAGA